MTTTGNKTETVLMVLSKEDSKLVSDYTAQVILLLQVCIFSSIINIIGIASNIINIIVFIKQGFGEVINISLFGLAIADICSLITLQWLNICFSPAFHFSDIPFYSIDVAYLSGGWPRMAFTRIIAFITAFITLERCLCITMPLKIKVIITPQRTVIIIVSIFLLLIGSVTPTYYTSRLVWRFYLERNRTLLGLGFTADRERIESVSFAINNVFLPIVALTVVVVCTVILAVKLNSKAEWRQKSTSKSDQMTNKDKNIVKMVSFISTIFIICFFPNAVIFSAMAWAPEFSVAGKYKNLFFITFSCSFILESFNSSINIFLYLKMSSKFRETFVQLFQGSRKRLNGSI